MSRAEEKRRSVEAYVAVPKRYGGTEGSERADGLAYVVPQWRDARAVKRVTSSVSEVTTT